MEYDDLPVYEDNVFYQHPEDVVRPKKPIMNRKKPFKDSKRYNVIHHNNVTVVQSVPQHVPEEREIQTTQYPKLGDNLSLCILVLTIVSPGLGTMIMGCCSKNCCEWYWTGVLQGILTYLIVGWIWSVYTGVKVYKNSR